MIKKIFSFSVLMAIVLLFSLTASCKVTYVMNEEIKDSDATMEEDKEYSAVEETPEETEEAAAEEIPEESYEEIALEENESVEESAEGTHGENTVDAREEPAEEISGGQEDETAEGFFLNLLNSFFEAVKTDTEYIYFSSATAAIVGTEEEYKNGTKSDYYFMIKESHSHWENIEIETVDINGDTANIGIIGDRLGEGTLYEGDKVTFRFVKENGEWKIDFS